MDIKELKLLKDILDCLNHINTYIGDHKVFELYANNPLLQDAVERNIITIGEAMNALLKLNPEIKITNARRIVDARNKLTHGYDEIEIVQIWSIIVNHLPILKEEVISFLNPQSI
ncbi:MAG TPA: HepT-like ribonuclease domain-containing protein [Pelobium sp.]